MRVTEIRFDERRKARPRNKITLGFEGDNMVERLEFTLPVIAEAQTAQLMMGGKYANAVMLADDGVLTDDGARYHADLTAEIVGTDGEVEAYVQINGSGGEVWHSDVMVLITGELPDVETEIEQRCPTAVEAMLTEIAGHRSDMAETLSEAQAAADRAEEAAERAESGGGGSGSLGGYYVPNVDEDGTLTWEPSTPELPEAEEANIRGPEGKQGPQGSSGVFMGESEPTDPDINVWIDPRGEAYVPGSGGATHHEQLQGRDAENQHPISAIEGLQEALDDKMDAGTEIPEPYVLPPATPDTLGGMMPGEGLTVDEYGRASVEPEGEYELVREIVIEGNETPEIMVDQFADGTSLVAKQLLIRITQPPTSDRSEEHAIHTSTYNEKDSIAVCTIFLPYHKAVNSYGVNEICVRNGRLFGTTARTFSFTSLPNMSNNTPPSLIGETSAEYFKKVKIASYQNVFLPGTTIKIEAVRYNA